MIILFQSFQTPNLIHNEDILECYCIIFHIRLLSFWHDILFGVMLLIKACILDQALRILYCLTSHENWLVYRNMSLHNFVVLQVGYISFYLLLWYIRRCDPHFRHCILTWCPILFHREDWIVLRDVSFWEAKNIRVKYCSLFRRCWFSEVCLFLCCP